MFHALVYHQYSPTCGVWTRIGTLHSPVQLPDNPLRPLRFQMFDLKLRTSTKLLEPSDDSTLGLSLKLDFNPPDLGRDLLTFLLPFFFMIMTFWMKCI